MTDDQLKKAARSAFPHSGEDDLRAAYIRGAKYIIKKLKKQQQYGTSEETGKGKQPQAV